MLKYDEGKKEKEIRTFILDNFPSLLSKSSFISFSIFLHFSFASFNLDSLELIIFWL